MNPKENLSGFALLAAVLLLGNALLDSAIFFRLLVGLGLGYALTRAALGFAGSVNRAYRAGSTRLMRGLMLMFTATAVASTAFLYNQNPHDLNLWVNPINLGLVVGALMFGFGMSFAGCCASGVLTYFSSNLARPALILFCFGMGVFLGFPLQSQESWITDTLISTPTYADKGVYLPDLFPSDPLGGYFGAIVITAALAGLVSWLAHRYEHHRRRDNTYIGVDSEHQVLNSKPSNLGEHPFFSRHTYEALFVSRWSMTTGIAMIVVGIDPAAVAAFADRPIQAFTMPFLSHPVNVQNMGIMLGSVVSLLLAGRFFSGLSRMRLTAREAGMLVIAGLAMGLGTRFANGCNVGALFTPIANFSLSGWIFLVFMVAGGVIGNMLGRRMQAA
jgi:uncharacterized membrane protein YedE/YeeE